LLPGAHASLVQLQNTSSVQLDTSSTSAVTPYAACALFVATYVMAAPCATAARTARHRTVKCAVKLAWRNVAVRLAL